MAGIGKLAKLGETLSKFGKKVTRPIKRPVKKFMCEKVFGKEKTFTRKVKTTDANGNTIFTKETYTAKVPTQQSYQKYKYTRNGAGAALGLGLGGWGAYALFSNNDETDAVDESLNNPIVEPEQEPEATDTIPADSVPKPAVSPAPAANDSVPTPATVPAVLTDSVANDSVPKLVVPPAAPADSVPTDSVARPNIPAMPTDSVPTTPTVPPAANDSVPVTPTAPAKPQTPEERIAANEARIQKLEERVSKLENNEQTAKPEAAAANNIFGGSLNEISIKEYNVVKGDCLWNIAKHELQKANPGKTITNGHILAQVKEFIRLNPQIKIRI